MENEKQMRYCRKCGAKLNIPGGECLSCKIGGKNEIISMILSFLLPGLGQLYNGQKIKALIAFILAFIPTFFMYQIGIIISILMRLLCIYDAYLTLNYMKHGKPTEDTFSDFFKFLR